MTNSSRRASCCAGRPARGHTATSINGTSVLTKAFDMSRYGHSEVGKPLLQADQRSQRIAGRCETLSDIADRPAVGPQVGIVELVPGDRHRHRRARRRVGC